MVVLGWLMAGLGIGGLAGMAWEFARVLDGVPDWSDG